MIYEFPYKDLIIIELEDFNYDITLELRILLLNKQLFKLNDILKSVLI